jgi:UDP-N-acetylglucosamine 4,6-dehydratase
MSKTKSALNFLSGKTVLITGATGSFGRNFTKYLLANAPIGKLIIFSRDEFKQLQLKDGLARDGLDAKGNVRFFLGDVRDYNRLKMAFNGVNIVVHAAALKQVPTLEYNPFEAIKTNILGSQNVIEAALDQKVEKVLFISTDKAAQPINLYGATKLCAEKLFVSGNAYGGSRTEFSVVRYGNVMGSRGSIIEQLIKTKSGVVNITHEEMTRFWINLEQSFVLVLFALKNMAGGEIFVPKIPSMKVVTLFDVLAPGAKRKVTGIRPGEKLHETLLTKEESMHAFDLGDYFVILPENSEAFDSDKRFAGLIKIGKKLPAGFCYTSDTNEIWLTKEQFGRIIKSGLIPES